jgi:glycerophosphoryl diester phosphodiesterase
MQVLSHRGFHLGSPENTLEAFAKAIALGVDGIETDLRLSVDGEVILFHDRHAPGGHPLSYLSRNELSRAVGYEVPTLTEALQSHPQVFWDLEIKDPAAVPATLQLLKQLGKGHDVIISSFWHSALVAVRSSSSLPCGYLVCHRPVTVDSLSHDMRPGLDAIIWDYETLDGIMVQQAKERGIKNYAYGVQTEDEHRRLPAYHLDAVITDHPSFLLGLSTPIPEPV